MPEPRLRVYQRDGRWVVDSGGRDMPRWERVVGHLPVGVRRQCGTVGFGNSADNVLKYWAERAVIPLQPLVDATMVAMAELEAERTVGASAQVLERVDEQVETLPAYLCAGKKVYRLSLAAEHDATRVLTATRKRVVDSLRRKGEVYLTSARHEAAHIVEEATRIRSEAERLRTELNSSSRHQPPAWFVSSQRAIRYVGEDSPWAVLLNFCFEPTQAQFSLSPPYSHCSVPLVASSHSMIAWQSVRQDGRCSCNASLHFGNLPHMSTSGICAGIQGWPTTVTDGREFGVMEILLTRAMSAINLHSLLRPYSHWKALCPLPGPLEEVVLSGHRDSNTHPVYSHFRRVGASDTEGWRLALEFAQSLVQLIPGTVLHRSQDESNATWRWGNGG